MAEIDLGHVAAAEIHVMQIGAKEAQARQVAIAQLQAFARACASPASWRISPSPVSCAA
ncbi:MAG: hypothetical protein R3A10_03495 [Caldilineaceae bacterium]